MKSFFAYIFNRLKNYTAHNSIAVQGHQQSNWTLDVQEGGHILSKPNLTEQDNILQDQVTEGG